MKLKRSSDEGDEWGVEGGQQSHEGDILKYFQMRFLFIVIEKCCAKDHAKLVEPAPNESRYKKKLAFSFLLSIFISTPCAVILENLWGLRGLSYWPGRLHRLEESTPGLLKSLKIPFRVTSQLLCLFLYSVYEANKS